MARPDLDAIRQDLAFLDDWEERYRYIIDLGRALEPLTDAERSEDNKVRGCASQVWLARKIEREGDGPARLLYRGDSDAHIVKGLVALVLAMFSGRTAAEIRAADAQGFFKEIGLASHLTQQRSNGLASMVAAIKRDAEAMA